MLPDRVSNPGPLTYESGALPIALRGPAYFARAQVAQWVEHWPADLEDTGLRPAVGRNLSNSKWGSSFTQPAVVLI